ncbi:cell division protein FtsA [Solitalea canadensis]|uniref:Cell division protein FtsA n=1 Tax=Solitalea canadensis (strain ATCC 29591 / DSM 3403 / JCM 21819 / LMG 8368 / NBRC 15130 / NCIMB 12057 / USAM 9D) TaxID=929556 RepID=H8KRX9_SOLCM|nr:cell division protein FtsA [Solitalea canadensis]AFD07767.1 cell division protein FtsA [Solitalea canadensis DSM 3403]
MENSDIVVGLDIGTTKICVIVGRRTEHGKIEVLGMGKADSPGVSRGTVTNIEKTVRGIREAVEIAELKSNVEINVVNIGIAGQHIKSHQHRGMLTRSNTTDEISHADVDKLISDMHKLAMNPGEKIIHVLPQEYVIDNEPGILDPVGMSGVRMEANFHIITGQVTSVQNIIKCATKASLGYDDIILEPLASAEAVLSPEEKEAGVVLVDIGGGTTDVAIFYRGLIRHTAVIPLGGNIVTDDIVEGLAILKAQAEVLKTRFGSTLADENAENEIISIPSPVKGRQPKEVSVRNLAYIIQARMEEIIEHIYYEIQCSGYEKKLIAGIVLTGGGAQLKHLPQLVEYVTGLDARIGYPNEHIAKSNQTEVVSPMYATGIGLVIKGLQALEEDRMKNDNVVSADKQVHQPQADRKQWLKKFIDPIKDFIREDIDDKDYLK